MKIGVIGAGYVGIELLKSLKDQSHEILITTTNPDKVSLLTTYGQVFVLDSSEETFAKLIDQCDTLVILVAPKNSALYEETYLQTALKISQALKNLTRPFYIIYTSSTSVFEGRENWVTEEMDFISKNEQPKILFETECVYLRSGAETCILRLGGIYGPKREFIDRAKRLSGKEMSGSGNESTNHIHLEDIVAGINFCLNNRLKGIYNLVNDDHPTRKELYTQLCESANIPPPSWNSNEEGIGYKVSNSKIKEIGFVFKHPFLS